ncbi:MAG: UDP-N-acetylglucosamine 1-carboxyvinyltransferase [Acidimicrobiales bacterium]|nr:UDP-N-acetylglucosamine 1-carboxyvinyltransferase [Acidimicrobiales bacterium]
MLAHRSAGGHTCGVPARSSSDEPGRPEEGRPPTPGSPSEAPVSGLDRFRVRESGPLEGTVAIGGAKNSALKLMVACLLAEGRHVLHNVPAIADVEIMAEVLRLLGAEVTRDGQRLIIDSPAELRSSAPFDLVERMRASVVLMGPLLARTGWMCLGMPGGDDFGSRPINFHLKGLEAMGAQFTFSHGEVEGRAGQLSGARIVLEYPSHTTTDNLLMAASLAKGTTVIENAAREPEVADLAAFLSRMGARITGAGTSRLEIEGVEALVPTEHEVIPDRVEAATFLAAVGLAGGEVLVERARPDHMDMLMAKMGEIGVRTSASSSGIWVSSDRRLTGVDLATLPYPGVATDYKPLLVTMLSVAQGAAIVTENLFDGRFRYTEELRRMGADIHTEGRHVVVRGVPRLDGTVVKSCDVRAGAALVLAGLVAEGETIVTDARHVDRGYEDLAGKLRSLGADVTRIA